MVSPASGGDARGSARAGLIFFGRALSLRLVTRRVAGSNPVTPALFSRRMLQRLNYTAEKASPASGGDARGSPSGPPGQAPVFSNAPWRRASLLTTRKGSAEARLRYSRAGVQQRLHYVG